MKALSASPIKFRAVIQAVALSVFPLSAPMAAAQSESAPPIQAQADNALPASKGDIRHLESRMEVQIRHLEERMEIRNRNLGEQMDRVESRMESLRENTRTIQNGLYAIFAAIVAAIIGMLLKDRRNTGTPAAVLIFVMLTVAGAVLASSCEAEAAEESESIQSDSGKPAAIMETAEISPPIWKTECHLDEMDDSTNCYAYSPPAKSKYSRSWSEIAYFCDGETWNLAIRFEYLNIAGENEGAFKVRWDKSPAILNSFYQPGDRRPILFWENESQEYGTLDSLKNHNEFRLQIPYHAEGNQVFLYSLAGSSGAIAQASDKCGLTKKDAAVWDPSNIALKCQDMSHMVVSKEASVQCFVKRKNYVKHRNEDPDSIVYRCRKFGGSPPTEKLYSDRHIQVYGNTQQVLAAKRKCGIK